MSAASQIPDDVTEQVERAVVRIFGVAKDRDAANWGTGFVIGTDGQRAYILTANHVVEENRIYVSVEGTTTYKEVKILGFASEEQGDIALLKICCGDFYSLPLVDSKQELARGTIVASTGYPGDHENLTTSHGKVLGISHREPHNTEIVVSDVPSGRGGSGGPIYLANMKSVVGMITGGGVERIDGVWVEEVTTSAVSSRVILEFLRSWIPDGSKVILPTPAPFPGAPAESTLPFPTWRPLRGNIVSKDDVYSIQIPSSWIKEQEVDHQFEHYYSPEGNASVRIHVIDDSGLGALNLRVHRILYHNSELSKGEFARFKGEQLSQWNSGKTSKGFYTKLSGYDSDNECFGDRHEYVLTHESGNTFWISLQACQNVNREIVRRILDGLIFHGQPSG